MRKSRKYIFNAVLLAAVTVAMRAIGVSFNAFVTRKAGAGAVGLFTLVGSVYSLAVTLGLSGVNLAAVRLTSRCLALCEAQGMSGCEMRKTLKREMGGCIVYALFFGTLAGLLLHALAYPVGTYILGFLPLPFPPFLFPRRLQAILRDCERCIKMRLSPFRSR